MATWPDSWLTADEARAVRATETLESRPPMQPANRAQSVPRPGLSLARVVQRLAQTLAYSILACITVGIAYGMIVLFWAIGSPTN